MSAAKHLVSAAAVGALAVACSDFLTPDAAPSLSQADADALADAMLGDIEASGVGNVSTRTLDAPPATPVSTGVLPQTPCSPQRLTPAKACAFGGNVYTTINQSCPDANLGACCASIPSTCAEFEGNFSGQTKTLYNGCRTALGVEANGTINGTMTGEITGNCSGAVGVSVTIVDNGSFSVRINGVDACPGGVSLRTRIVVYDRATLVMTGSVCGLSVYRTSKSDCFVACGDKCCPNGSYCGRCGTCLPSTYPVDCCETACPNGTVCSGSKCSL